MKTGRLPRPVFFLEAEVLFSCPPEGVRPAGDETGAASPTRFLPSCPPEGVRPAGDETGAASPTRFLPSLTLAEATLEEAVRPHAGEEAEQDLGEAEAGAALGD